MLILHRVYTGEPGPYPWGLKAEGRDTLDRVSTHHRAQSLLNNLEMLIGLQHTSEDSGRKPQNPEKTHKAPGEHVDTAPPTPEVQDKHTNH